jgi:hypothetical protein
MPKLVAAIVGYLLVCAAAGTAIFLATSYASVMVAVLAYLACQTVVIIYAIKMVG